jgi:hypothetical protein
MDSADPCHGPLEPEAEARVNERAVFSQVQVPAVRFDGQVLLFDSRQQLVVVVLAL